MGSRKEQDKKGGQLPADQAEKQTFGQKYVTHFKDLLSKGAAAFTVLVLFIILGTGLWFLIGGKKYKEIKDFADHRDTTSVQRFSGIVLDMDDRPISGLTVVIEGLDAATGETGLNGRFSFRATIPLSAYELVIKFVDEHFNQVDVRRIAPDFEHSDKEKFHIFRLNYRTSDSEEDSQRSI